jgi:putative ABC transport system permease protein
MESLLIRNFEVNMASLVIENIKISLRSIKSQLLRTVLTVLIIAIGITALVGILTAIDSIKQSINSNFTSMGANTFTVRNREMTVRIGRNGKRPKKFRPFTYEEAITFKNQFNFPSQTSISTMATGTATLRYAARKTNPNIQVFGGDENYIATSGYDLEKGRGFSMQEIQYNAHVAIIGSEIRNVLFGPSADPVDQIISIGSAKYKIIGLLKPKGSSMGFGGDKISILPLGNVREYYGKEEMSYIINVLNKSPKQMDIAIGEATGLLRKIRKVTLGEENNFEIVKSDSLAGILIDNIKYVTWAATIIGMITLIGAAIGLMNIMLVSVTERTREIGIRKSLGATREIIKRQFLVEAIVICQLGGFLGIVLGILIGNVISFFVGSGFIIPWVWIISGVVICLVVGLAAGLYPAIKASKLDPIEALRFE